MFISSVTLSSFFSLSNDSTFDYLGCRQLFLNTDYIVEDTEDLTFIIFKVLWVIDIVKW